MKELSIREKNEVSGGVIPIGLIVGVAGGLIGVYEFGKALGRLMK